MSTETPTENAEAAGTENEARPTWMREYAEAFVIAALFLRFTNAFVFETFYIPSGSMEQTLLIGDHLVVNRFIYGQGAALGVLPSRPIERGDIVIFRSPQSPSQDLVKRCIGLPGDTVDLQDKQLFINGQRVDDSSYARHDDLTLFADREQFTLQQRTRDNFGPFVVPAKHYFCMGDNRDFSYDSRFWGPLPEAMVKGRAVMIYWSYGGEVSDGTWRSWGTKLRQVGKTLVGFFPKTRWSRSFDVVR